MKKKSKKRQRGLTVLMRINGVTSKKADVSMKEVMNLVYFMDTRQKLCRYPDEYMLIAPTR